MTVGAIAAHLVSTGIEMVSACLSDDERPSDRVLDPVRVYSGQTLDLDHEGHQGVRDRADEGAELGAQTVAGLAMSALHDLTISLPQQAQSRQVLLVRKFDMTLDGFLVTRMVELLAHTDDLASSVGLATPEFPSKAYDIVIHCLCDVARRRHGDLEVLRALARRERSRSNVFPVF
jgi:hypothetical protein